MRAKCALAAARRVCHFEISARFRPPLARSLAIIVVLLLGMPPSSRGAEPTGATILLQLPPSMPPDVVKGLITDLAAKGAHQVAQPIDPAEAAAQPAFTTANVAAQAWDGSKQAVQAIPVLRQAPQIWIEQVEADGGTPGLALRFWLVALAVLVAAPAIGRAFRELLDRRQARVTAHELAPRLRAAIIRFLIATTSVALFGVVYWTALLCASSGRPILEETADRLVWAALIWRLLIIILMIVVSPQRSDLRLLAIDDADARTCSRWFAVYLTINPFNVFLIWLVERLGFGHDAVFGAALALGLPITAYKVAMFWAVRRPIGRAILASGGGPGPFRRGVAASWHWLFIALAVGILVAATIELSLGRGAWVARASAATQGIVVAPAVLWQASQNLIARLFLGEAADVRLILRRERFRRALRRLSDAFFWILGAAWLGVTWGLDLVDPAPGSFERLFVRPAFEAAATVVIAWVLWIALSAIIDEKMPRGVAPGDEDEVIASSASRLGTLLPLVRNTVLIGLAVIAVIVALSTLGLDIGPLLAGLGVIGIAIGFGAQTLVRDVISGLFFLMEDAFRVGEYINTGRLRGTVEGMSLRSVRLRHQNGQIHTIPFGQVQAVTNFSRDWSVVKFNLHLEPTADIETVRKTIKRVGEELLDDPEIGSEFIQPLKLQGVVDVLQTALVVRCKFTARPIRPAYIQRQALRCLIDAFAMAELRFAAPNVTVQLASVSAG
jgi:small-conductance mechanosensitive channel